MCLFFLVRMKIREKNTDILDGQKRACHANKESHNVNIFCIDLFERDIRAEIMEPLSINDLVNWKLQGSKKTCNCLREIRKVSFVQQILLLVMHHIVCSLLIVFIYIIYSLVCLINYNHNLQKTNRTSFFNSDLSFKSMSRQRQKSFKPFTLTKKKKKKNPIS